MLDHIAAENAGAARSARSARWSAPRSATAGVDLAINGPLLAPGIGAQGATPARPARRLRRRGAQVLPSVSRECCGTAPTPARCGTPRTAFADEVRAAVAGELTAGHVDRVGIPAATKPGPLMS